MATTGLAASTLCESLQLLFENRQCCKLLEGKEEMFSQFRSRSKDSLGVSIFNPSGSKVELAFVRRHLLLHKLPKLLVERIQMFWRAIRSCVGIPLLRKEANTL